MTKASDVSFFVLTSTLCRGKGKVQKKISLPGRKEGKVKKKTCDLPHARQESPAAHHSHYSDNLAFLWL